MDLTLPAPLGLWLVGVEGFQGILTAQPVAEVDEQDPQM